MFEKAWVYFALANLYRR